MDNRTLNDYLKITNGVYPQKYLGADEQGKSLKRCTILKPVEIGYSNSSSYPMSKENNVGKQIKTMDK